MRPPRLPHPRALRMAAYLASQHRSAPGLTPPTASNNPWSGSGHKSTRHPETTTSACRNSCPLSDAVDLQLSLLTWAIGLASTLQGRWSCSIGAAATPQVLTALTRGNNALAASSIAVRPAEPLPRKLAHARQGSSPGATPQSNLSPQNPRPLTCDSNVFTSTNIRKPGCRALPTNDMYHEVMTSPITSLDA